MGRKGSKKRRAQAPPPKAAEVTPSPATTSFPRRTILAAALIVGFTLAAMAPGLPGDLLNWDDDRFLRDNEMIRGLHIEGVREILSGPHFEAYHPVHLLSYMVDYELFGLWAPGIKAINLALYLLCLALLFRLLRRLGLGELGAFAAVLIFAVHPLHVEAVVWATARKETLSLALMLGAALAHLRSRRPLDRDGVIALSLFALAILTKTSTVVLPVLLLAIDVLIRRRSWTLSIVAVVPMALLAAVVGLYVISLWEENAMTRPLPSAGPLGALALVGKTYWHYLTQTLAPIGLSPVYPTDRVGAFDLNAALGFATWGALLALSLRSGDRLLALGVLIGAIALLPVSNIVPVYFHVQDRYALIATIGAALVVGRLVERAAGSRWEWAGRGALALAVVALTITSGLQARHWQSSRSLWEQAASAQPRAFYAQLGLGHTLRDEGDLDGAIAAYRRAISLEPELEFGQVSLCLVDARRNAQRRERPEGEVDRIGQTIRQRWGSAQGLDQIAGPLHDQGYQGCAELVEHRAAELRRLSGDERPQPAGADPEANDE